MTWVHRLEAIGCLFWVIFFALKIMWFLARRKLGLEQPLSGSCWALLSIGSTLGSLEAIQGFICFGNCLRAENYVFLAQRNWAWNRLCWLMLSLHWAIGLSWVVWKRFRDVFFGHIFCTKNVVISAVHVRKNGQQTLWEAKGALNAWMNCLTDYQDLSRF